MQKIKKVAAVLLAAATLLVSVLYPIPVDANAEVVNVEAYDNAGVLWLDGKEIWGINKLFRHNDITGKYDKLIYCIDVNTKFDYDKTERFKVDAADSPGVKLTHDQMAKIALAQQYVDLNWKQISTQYNLDDRNRYAFKQVIVWRVLNPGREIYIKDTRDTTGYSDALEDYIYNKACAYADQYMDRFTGNGYVYYGCGQDTGEFYLTPKIHISKVDENNQPLPYASFIVYDANNQEVDRWQSDGTDHEITLEAGDYTLVESAEPAGYQKIEDPISFTVDENANVTINTQEITGGSVQASDNNITVSDQKTPTTPEFIIKKLASDKVPTDGKSLSTVEGQSGATLQLFNTTTGTYVDSGSWTTTGQGAHFSTGAGTYFLKEKTPPDGYESIGGVYFTVDENNNVTVNPVDGKTTLKKGYAKVEADNPNTLYIIDEAKPKDKVIIKKTDAQVNPLAGASFTLYRTSPSFETIGTNLTTDDDNVDDDVDDTGVVLEDALEAGTYVLMEDTAPDGFESIDYVNFTVDDNRNVTVTYGPASGKGSATANGNILTIADARKQELPSTGGKGTAGFLLGGTALMGSSAWYRYKSKRKK